MVTVGRAGGFGDVLGFKYQNELLALLKQAQNDVANQIAISQQCITVLVETPYVVIIVRRSELFIKNSMNHFPEERVSAVLEHIQ